MRRRTALHALGAGFVGWSAVRVLGAAEDGAAPSIAHGVRATRQDAPVAATAHGRIRGARAENGILTFKGVPYGSDTSTRRFRPPVAPAPWTGVRQTTTFGPIAPQPGMRDRTQSEDCLHLNVWTPAVGTGRRPVMVWFHPGGYSSGTSNEVEADGARLSRRGDVVVVSVNHRLNVFGHLYLGEIGGERFADSGNVGILDLILALQWVRENVAEFGGDAGNVTIFGQSGGGAKSATLMAMPAARGLFRRVITMSGQQITGSRISTATRHAEQFLDALKISRHSVDQLLTAPLSQLVAASRAPSYTGPVTDGRSLPRDPFDPDAPPLSADIPMILGNTRGETRTLIGRGDPSIFALSWETLPAKLQANSPFMGDLDRREVIAQYRQWHPAYTPADVFFAATTDSRSWRGQVIEAERRAQQPIARDHTWVYQLDWGTPIDGGRWGAHHGLDVPLVFDNAVLVPEKVGTAPEAADLAGRMSDACLAFAHTGNPGTPRLPPWPTYDLKRRRTMIFDVAPVVAEDPRGNPRRLFAQVPYVQPGT